jgi:hypothetical protein
MRLRFDLDQLIRILARLAENGQPSKILMLPLHQHDGLSFPIIAASSELKGNEPRNGFRDCS